MLGTAAGLLAAAALTAPAALAGPLAAETSTPPPSPSGSATPGGATSSAAAAGYRFWGFFQQNGGKWEFAKDGPYQVLPKDESVDGWRFATAAMTDTRPPRNVPSFADICGKTPAEAGKKRVGVVVDYGRKADATGDANPPAPIARCASIPTGASSAEALNRVASPREDKGMVCGIDGWPGGSGCGDPVATIAPEAKAADDKVDISVTAAREQPKPQDAGAPAQAAEQGPSKKLLTAIAVVVVALAAGLAWLLSRRRRTALAEVPATAGERDGAAGPGGTGASGVSEGGAAAPRDPDARP